MMELVPVVTIAIPVYNAGPFLGYAIQSVLNQSYNDWELLLIDDGSTDSSLTIMNEFAKQDERIRVISDGVNKGLISRLNQSISLAHGKYYARMDADDIMWVTRLERQVAFLEANPDIDVVGASAMLINAKNEVVGSGNMEGVKSGFIHPTVMGKTKWFKQNPYSDWPLRAEDTELWLRTSKFSKFYNLQEPLLFYREFGVPSLDKYLKSQKTLRKIFANYKVYGKSFFWFAENSIESYVKSFLFSLFVAVGKSDSFIKMRRRKLLPRHLLLSSDDLLRAIRKN